MFASGAFLAIAFRTKAKALPSVELPEGWGAFALASGGYVCPMVAQLALLRGMAWGYADGHLVIGGAVLIGRAGGDYRLTSATAAQWVTVNHVRGVAELTALTALSPSDAAAWRADRQAKLWMYAEQVVYRASFEADAARQAALICESDWALQKWGENGQ